MEEIGSVTPTQVYAILANPIMSSMKHSTRHVKSLYHVCLRFQPVIKLITGTEFISASCDLG